MTDWVRYALKAPLSAEDCRLIERVSAGREWAKAVRIEFLGSVDQDRYTAVMAYWAAEVFEAMFRAYRGKVDYRTVDIEPWAELIRQVTGHTYPRDLTHALVTMGASDHLLRPRDPFGIEPGIHGKPSKITLDGGTARSVRIWWTALYTMHPECVEPLRLTSGHDTGWLLACHRSQYHLLRTSVDRRTNPEAATTAFDPAYCRGMVRALTKARTESEYAREIRELYTLAGAQGVAQRLMAEGAE